MCVLKDVCVCGGGNVDAGVRGSSGGRGDIDERERERETRWCGRCYYGLTV